jgi:hypothetical protein
MLQVTDWNNRYENNRTRELKRMDWVPVPNKMDGDGYTELLDHPNGPAHLGVWLAILQIASRCQVRGTLTRDNGQPHTAETLGRISRIPAAIFQECVPRLISIGWMDESHERAEIPQDGARSLRVTDYGMEGNGMEGKNICASNFDARVGEPQIDNPPFETTEPNGLFPEIHESPKTSPRPQDAWFDEFWQVYWLKKAKKPAQRAFQKAVKTTSNLQR